MSEDTLHELLQAKRILPMDDWHPVAMALFLMLFVKTAGTISFVAVVQLLLLWGALFLFSYTLFRKTNNIYKAVIPFGFGLLPMVAAISGTVWKDVFMAFLLLFAVALLSVIELDGRRSKIRVTLIIFVLCIFVLASLYRHNALLATIPLFLYTIHVHVYRLSLKGAVAVLGFFVGGVWLLNISATLVFSASKTHPISAVQLDDLLAIRRQVGRGGINDTELQGLLNDIEDSCVERKVDINSYILCTSKAQKQSILANHKGIAVEWVNALVHHPVAYMKFRIYTFALFLAAPLDKTYIYEHRTIKRKGENHYLATSDSYRQRAHRLLTYEVGANSAAILFKPILWLLLSIFGIAYIAKKRSIKLHLFPLALFGSALLYIVGYFPTVVATDYRYIYWPVLATLIGLTILFIHRGNLRYPPKSVSLKTRIFH